MPANKHSILALKAPAEDAKNRSMRAALDSMPIAKPNAKPKAKPKHGGARPGSGRPAIKPGEATVTITIRVTESQRAKFEAIGGSARFRAWLERVKV